MSASSSPAVLLYRQLLDAWNRRDAAAFAGLFTEDGEVTGFDGSMMSGRQQIESTLAGIFGHHPTGAYVGAARSVRQLTPDVETVRAVAGMVPAGASDLNPALNAVQTLVAVTHAGRSLIASFQNTPAAFHGRPQAVDELTRELRALLADSTAAKAPADEPQGP